MNEEELKKNCLHCGSKNIKFTETKNSIHYGRIDCLDCGRWNKWVQKPDNGEGRIRTSKYKIDDILKFHKKDKEFCWFCLRDRNKLGFSETLTIDHIEELDKGGKDELENLQILCSSCHKLKNWVRLYMNWHLDKFYNEVKKDD